MELCKNAIDLFESITVDLERWLEAAFVRSASVRACRRVVRAQQCYHSLVFPKILGFNSILAVSKDFRFFLGLLKFVSSSGFNSIRDRIINCLSIY